MFVLGCDVFCIYIYICHNLQFLVEGMYYPFCVTQLCSLTTNCTNVCMELFLFVKEVCTHVNNEMQCNWNKNSALCLLKPFAQKITPCACNGNKNLCTFFFYVETISQKVGCPICTCMSHVNYHIYTRILLSICTRKISVSLLFQM